MVVNAESSTWVPLLPGLLRQEDDGSVTLLGSRCEGCGTTYFPAMKICVRCLSPERMLSAPLSRRGTVYTFSVVRQSLPEFPTPYVLAYVDLPEGVRVLSQLADVSPEAAHIGMEVELVGAITRKGDADQPEVLGFRFRCVTGKGS